MESAHTLPSFALPFLAISLTRIIDNIFYDSRPDGMCAGSIHPLVRTCDLPFPGHGRAVLRRAWSGNGATFDPRGDAHAGRHSGRRKRGAGLVGPR